MINCIGGPVSSPDGTLNPDIAKYCYVNTIEFGYDEPMKIEITVKEPINMDTITSRLCNEYAKLMGPRKKKTHRERDLIDRVLHNPPATIVFWKDGTKTVVKQQDGDVYNPEHGFTAACAKKLFGNDNQFNYELKWYVPKQEPAVEDSNDDRACEVVNVEFGETYSGPIC